MDSGKNRTTCFSKFHCYVTPFQQQRNLKVTHVDCIVIKRAPCVFSEQMHMDADIKEVLISAEEIQRKLVELGRKLSQDYQDKNPLFVCILKGAVPFTANLVQHIDIPLEMDFMSVSSYGGSAQTSGVVRIIKDLETSIEGRDVLIVEDIIDTGLTLHYLIDLLKQRNPASIKTVALLDKKECRTVDIQAEYLGFSVPNAFVVGYGLDFAEKYRNLPYIGVLKERIYQN